MTPLERATSHPLMLGLFLPLQSGGWTPSTAPRSTDWSFDYNARLACRAEQLDFDLVFGLAQWLGKDGYGGATRYRADSIDPFIVTAGLSAVTKKVLLISTLHILYGPLHPLHVAKLGATIDHMSGGRWGINVVTGFAQQEFKMFGMQPIEHDKRYAMAAEFTDILFRLWEGDENVTFRGEHWQLEEAFAAPRPLHGRPVMVNAASSPAGLAYAAKYADLIFITSPGGADAQAAVETLPEQTAKVRTLAAASGREVRTLVNPHIICRETDREAQEAFQAIADAADGPAVDAVFGRFQQGDTASWRGHTRDQRIVGGNIQLIGSPETIVDWCLKLKAAGCDGIQINFFDFEPDLEFFGNRVIPLLKQAGLRNG